MRFEILGPLRIRANDGGEIVVRSRNERTVLGVLLLRAGEAVSVEHLVDALWPNRPPASHVSNLHTYVSRLRFRLPSVALEHVNGSYRLPVSSCDLDLLEFRKLSAAGRIALDRGDPVEAVKLLRLALRRWRGRPLADLSIALLEPEVAQLEAERLGVVEDQLGAELGSSPEPRDGGDTAWAHVIHELQGLIAEYPLRERLHGHLMVAMCRAGRRADALSAYQSARQTFVGELGIEPGPGLQRLHQGILRGEEPVVTRSRRGGTRPTLRASVFPVCQLPPPVSGFVGRDEIVRRASALAAPTETTVPVVVISGQPGVGKSALALRVAHQVRAAYPDGQLYAHLGGAGGPSGGGHGATCQLGPGGRAEAPSGPLDPAGVIADLLLVLGVPASALPRDLAALSAAYRTRLADRRVLVVLDDASDPAQVRALTPGTPGSAVIVTSRSRLSGLTDAAHLPLGPLRDDEAHALLERVVGPSRVAREGPQASRIAAACGNLPLALRIAGTRLATRALRLETLADRLDDERRRLTELAISDQQVRASLAPSVEALSAPAREAFALVGQVAAVEFPAWAVAALLGERDADAVIDELIEASLLEPVGSAEDDHPPSARYRMHDLLRVYSEELCSRRPDGGATGRRRLLAVATTLAHAALRASPRVLTWSRLEEPAPGALVPQGAAKLAESEPLAWFSAERPLLVSLVSQASAAGDDRFSTPLAERVAPYLWTAGHWIDLDRVLRFAMVAAENFGEERALGLLRFVDGVLSMVRGDLASAASRFESSGAGFQRLGDRHGLACVLSDQAVLYDYQGRSRAAVRAAGEAVELFRADGDVVGAILASPGLSAALRGLGRVDEAFRVDQAAVAAARTAGAAPVVLARCLNALALSHLMLADPAGAHRAAEEAARLLRGAGDRYVLLATLRQQALAAVGLGRRREAVALLERSHELAVDLGERLWATGLERDLAVSWIGAGRAGAAVTALRGCLRTFHEMDFRSGKAATLGALARAYDEMGRASAARAARRGAARLASPDDARTPTISEIVLRLADPDPDPDPPDQRGSMIVPGGSVAGNRHTP